MDFCEGLRDDYRHYTFYIQHYLLPWFESLRRDQRLEKGQKQITVDGAVVEYSGEILDGDIATGDGEFIDMFGDKYTGHFVNDMKEGAGVMMLADGNRWEGEVRENQQHGK